MIRNPNTSGVLFSVFYITSDAPVSVFSSLLGPDRRNIWETRSSSADDPEPTGVPKEAGRQTRATGPAGGPQAGKPATLQVAALLPEAWCAYRVCSFIPVGRKNVTVD